MADVTLNDAEPDQKPVLENLFQLYIHDFSDFWARPRGWRAAGGRPVSSRYPPTRQLLARAGHEAMLIRADGPLAGFALINRRFALRRMPVDFTRAPILRRRGSIAAGRGPGRGADVLGTAAASGRWRSPGATSARRRSGARSPPRSPAAAVEELDRDDDLLERPDRACRSIGASVEFRRAFL